jgi:arginyl-tRNA synthetase
MLKSEAKRVIDFRWEQALSLAGDSAPYVQYAHARADSILRAAAEAASPAATAAPAVADAAVPGTGMVDRPADWDALGPLEVKLAQLIARYPEVVRNAAHDDAPHVVAQYALELATAWNGYYNHRGPDGRPDTAVLRAEPGLREARLALVAKVRDTLARALSLLGVEAPSQM